MCPCNLEGVVVKVRSINLEGFARVYIRVLRLIGVIEELIDDMKRLVCRIDCCEGYESCWKLRNIDLGVAMTSLYTFESQCD